MKYISEEKKNENIADEFDDDFLSTVVGGECDVDELGNYKIGMEVTIVNRYFMTSLKEESA